MSLPTVAVAGGSGKLGRAIVDAVRAAAKFDVVVLARKADDEKAKEIGARIIAVDYNNADAITSVLQANNVVTVVSALSAEASPEHELNLIKGADQSAPTKRFIPSVWGIYPSKETAAYFPPMAGKLGAVTALESTSLEWTAVCNGFFLDYYVAPKVKSYMPPMAVYVDLAHDIAAIPGSGDVPVVFTHTFDVGAFVAALLTKHKWDAKESIVIGDKIAFNELVRIAEEIKGTKFAIERDSVAKLKTGQITELPSHVHLYPFFPKEQLQGIFSAFGLMFDKGLFDFQPSGPTLNDMFPTIKPKTVRDAILEAYGA